MSGMFGAISNIKVDTQRREAWFSYEDIKLHLHDTMIEVDQAMLSFEQFNTAMDQLDATVASIESMGGMVDEQVMSIVNHDNQLGKLFGIYIPESLRFEMADENKAGQTGNATQPTGTATDAKPAATDNEKQKTGESLVDKAKEVAKKLWEMLKAFFEKIARGLKSFWQWLMNGCMTNKASNEKLKAAILAEQSQGYPKTTKALQEAQGFIKADLADKNSKSAKALAEKLKQSPILAAMDNSDCSAVMLKLNEANVWQMNISQLLGGVDEAALKDMFLKSIPAGEGGLLPTISVDKESIKSAKQNKSAMSTLNWTPDLIIAVIDACNDWYDNCSKAEMKPFIEAAGKYNWEQSKYVTDGKVEPNMAKRQCQAVCRFYIQYCKILTAGVDILQAHINAVKKPFNVAVGQQQAAPQINDSNGPAQNQAGQQPQNG